MIISFPVMKHTVKILSLIVCAILSLSLISCGQGTDAETLADTSVSHEGHSHTTAESTDKEPVKPAETVLTVKMVDELGKYVHPRSVVKISGKDDSWIAISNAKGEARFTDAQFESVEEGFTLELTTVPEGYICEYVGANKLTLNPGVTELTIVLEKITPNTETTQN